MKFLTLFSPAVILSVLLATPVFAAEMELKFGHVGKPGSLFEASVNEFAKRANAKLAGKVKVLTFGSSQLGKDKELLKKLKLGTINFALPSSVMASVAVFFIVVNVVIFGLIGRFGNLPKLLGAWSEER